MKEGIRIKNPDGSFKIVFREKQEKEPEKNEINKVGNESKEKQNKSKKIADPRYFNPFNPGHIDIFGKDLLNKDLIFSLSNGETIKGKMTGFGQYEILIEFDGRKIILMKNAITKVEVL